MTEPSPSSDRRVGRVLLATVRELEEALADARSRLEASERERQRLARDHQAVLGSRTWRWTLPLRRAADALKRLLRWSARDRRGPRVRGAPAAARRASPRQRPPAAPADPLKAAQRRVGAIGRRLFELGFTERPLAELRELMASERDPHAKRLAARELARWHAGKRSRAGAERCLRALEIALDGETDPTRRRQAAVLAAESHGLLGEVAAGRRAIDEALELGPHEDLYFAAANLEAEARDRVPWINRALRLHGLAEVRLDDSEASSGRPAFDALRPAAEPSPQAGPGEDGPKVSVIMPSHNAAATIATALDSALSQTWRRLEVLVVDDGSADATAAVVEERALRDPRIRLLRASSNRGTYVARNLALQAATGELVTCHDADDWSHPEKIERQVRHLLAHPDAVANTSRHVRVTRDLRFYRRTNHGYFALPAMPSLLLRREPMLERVGYWDCVRFGADAELIRRARKVFGARSVVDLETGPLSFLRTSSRSLTGDAAFGYGGFLMGARREYLEAQKDFHSRAGTLRYEFPQPRRPFAVPEPMRPAREAAPAGRRRFDLILVSDFRRDDAGRRLELRLAARLGLRVGLIQMSSYDLDPGTPIRPVVRELVDGDRVQILVYGERVGCRALVVGPPEVVEEPQRFVPDVEAGGVHVLAGPPEGRGWGDGGTDRAYDLGVCRRRLVEHWGGDGLWHPLDPAARAALVEHAPATGDLRLASRDWEGLLALVDGWNRLPAQPAPSRSET